MTQAMRSNLQPAMLKAQIEPLKARLRQLIGPRPNASDDEEK